MLNTNLKLNEKLFDKDVEIAPTRAGFGDALLELGGKNPNVVVLSADLTESTHAHKFAKSYPERFFELGIGEQNMAAVAAGMGVTGKIPFIASYATFSPGKNWETIRTTCVYNRANVKIAGHHSGIMTGPDGATHQATEDIAITRCLPGLDIFVPCDSIEAKKATLASVEINGPVYLRYTRDKTPIITTEETPFEKGRMYDFWVSEDPQVTIFSMGYMTYYSLLAAKELTDEGINVLVINTPSVKPIDVDEILKFTEKSKAVVTVEDHQITGGLGSAISESLSRNNPLPIEFIGLQDTFAESGTPSELLEKYGMGKDAIKEAVKKVIDRKS
jgi:transketolase